jgi:hypothetical protein
MLLLQLSAALDDSLDNLRRHSQLPQLLNLVRGKLIRRRRVLHVRVISSGELTDRGLNF